jgi:hypothetical protein
MEHLSKHQLVLVALLVSFVTSLATGIVTVALMDQAPSGVTRTITQVIRQTVSDATGSGASSTAAVAISVNDQVADATAEIAASIVRIRDGDAGPMAGLGLIVSPSGTVVVDKSIIDNLNNPEAVYPDGKGVPISVVRFQLQGDIAFLAPARPLSHSVKPITFGDAARLGSSVWSLSGTTTYTLSQGIVSRLYSSSTTSAQIIQTTISGSDVMPGAPLFDAIGSAIGIGTRSLSGSDTAAFYPLSAIKSGLPQ